AHVFQTVERNWPVSEQAAAFQRLGTALGNQSHEICLALLRQATRPQLVSQLLQAACDVGVTAAEVTGRNGALTGYLQDEAVFGVYLRERSWFWNAVEFLNTFYQRHHTGTFIDIGANIGAVVVPVAKANPAIDCFAFEPDPANYRMLIHNIARNGV